MVRIPGCTRPVCVCALVAADTVGGQADFYDVYIGPRGTMIIIDAEPSLFGQPPEPVPTKTTFYADVRNYVGRAAKWFGEVSWRPASKPDYA